MLKRNIFILHKSNERQGQVVTLLVFGSIIRGSSLNVNHYTLNKVVIAIKYSLIHYFTILSPGYRMSEICTSTEIHFYVCLAVGICFQTANKDLLAVVACSSLHSDTLCGP